jgi:hypothetical protein
MPILNEVQSSPGKYDNLCTKVREAAKANTAIIIIIEGKKAMGLASRRSTL